MRVFHRSGPAGLVAAGIVLTSTLTAGASVRPQAVAGDLFSPVSPTRVLDTRIGLGVPGGSQSPLAGGQTLTLHVAGVAGVPVGADAVVMNVTAVAPSASTYVSVYPGNLTSPPAVSNLNVAAHQTVPNLVTVKLDAAGDVNLFNAVGAAHLLADVTGYYDTTAADTYVPLDPTRILDTRSGLGAPAHPIGPGAAIDLQVAGVDGIPSDAAAVVLNVTATQASAATYVQVYPTPASGTAFPVVSNLNLTPGTTAANLVTVGVGALGRVRLRNAVGAVQVLADVAGYFSSSTTGSRFVPLTPIRIMDSRTGQGEQVGQTGPLGPGGLVDLQITGVAGVPAGASAVLFNYTGVAPLASTYVQAYATPSSGTGIPLVSNINLAPGQVRANLASVIIGAGGRVRLRNQVGSTDLLADLAGYYTTSAGMNHGAGPPTPSVLGTAVTATVSPSTPYQNTSAVVQIITAPFASVTATAQFSTGPVVLSGTASAAGTLHLDFAVGASPIGVMVPVTLFASSTALGATATGAASFVPIAQPTGGTTTPVAETVGTTYQTNGRVNAIVTVGDITYIAGDFTSVRPSGSPLGSNEHARSRLAAFTTSTGALLPWSPAVDGSVEAMSLSADGATLFLGGVFGIVGGLSRGNLAEVNATTGAVSTWHPTTNGKVYTLVATATSVYIGGTFTQVDGVPRGELASISTTGTLDQTWHPEAAGGKVLGLALSTDGTSVFIGGEFTSLNGLATWAYFGKVAATSGALQPWAAHPGIVVEAFAVTPTRIFFGEDGPGGHVDAYNLPSGTHAWGVQTDGGIQAVAVDGSILYAGGHQDNICLQGGSGAPFICTGSKATRHKLVALDAGTGGLLQWDPGANSNLGIFALTMDGGRLLAGGDFTTIGRGQDQQGYAQFSPAP